MVRVNFHLSKNHIEDLKRLSLKMDLTVSELVRRAVERFCEENLSKKKVKDGNNK
jgi:hypothetical protein